MKKGNRCVFIRQRKPDSQLYLSLTVRPGASFIKSKPQFQHLQKGEKNSTYPVALHHCADREPEETAVGETWAWYKVQGMS